MKRQTLQLLVAMGLLFCNAMFSNAQQPVSSKPSMVDIHYRADGKTIWSIYTRYAPNDPNRQKTGNVFFDLFGDLSKSESDYFTQDGKLHLKRRFVGAAMYVTVYDRTTGKELYSQLWIREVFKAPKYFLGYVLEPTASGEVLCTVAQWKDDAICLKSDGSTIYDGNTVRKRKGYTKDNIAPERLKELNPNDDPTAPQPVELREQFKR